MLQLPKIIRVRDLAEKLEVPVTKIIGALMKNGVMATINQSVDYETAAIVADDLGIETALEEEAEQEETVLSDTQKKALKPRPPVVTVMGHVDHGKTMLLDAIRKTKVMESESGGITQHIGAYQVEVKGRLITFLDTPGHEAFSAMRAHGANVTDIVILVVAATEGVKPQTIEAISHARAAQVPIIVALTKMDLPEADPERAKRELADVDLAPEEWGGKNVMVPVSAKSGKGINELLEMILLTADLKELKANSAGIPRGIVIESHLQVGFGPVATMIIQDGTLKLGDYVVLGATWGKIRIMEDFRGKRIKEAGPSMPVRIAGLHDIPSVGAKLHVVEDEKTARQKTATKTVVSHQIGIGEVSEAIKEGKVKELNLIIKGDTQGSIDAIKNSLEVIGHQGPEGVSAVKVKFILNQVGPISESDVNMAIASKALVVGFRVRTAPVAAKLAKNNQVKISSYEIIYQLVDDITAALQGLLEPEILEVPLGKLEILKIFRTDKGSQIVGGRLFEGKLDKGAFLRIKEAGEVIGEGKILSVKRGPEEVTTLNAPTECGLAVETSIKMKPKQIIEGYVLEEHVRKISRSD